MPTAFDDSFVLPQWYAYQLGLDKVATNASKKVINPAYNGGGPCLVHRVGRTIRVNLQRS
jgi:hypothetical protein